MFSPTLTVIDSGQVTASGLSPVLFRSASEMPCARDPLEMVEPLVMVTFDEQPPSAIPAHRTGRTATRTDRNTSEISLAATIPWNRVVDVVTRVLRRQQAGRPGWSVEKTAGRPQRAGRSSTFTEYWYLPLSFDVMVAVTPYFTPSPVSSQRVVSPIFALTGPGQATASGLRPTVLVSASEMPCSRFSLEMVESVVTPAFTEQPAT